MDNLVVGLGACSTDARVGTPSEDIGAGQVEFSEELIARLLYVSFLKGDGDPRTVQLSNDYNMEEAVGTIFSEEEQAMALLQESNLYWVETNPVLLYALGAGMSMCLFPFLQGFFSELGSRAADWLWEQVVDQSDCASN